MKAFFKKLKYTPYELSDAIVIDLINLFELINFSIKKIFGKFHFLEKNEILKKVNIDKRIFLLGNAPSLNSIDIKKLKNEAVIMVNRSFEHPDYEIVKPKYHIIVDSKLASGEWPLEYIDLILKKNPSVTLLLNAKWFHLEKFSSFRNKKNIFWIMSNSISLLFNNFNNDLTSIFNSGAVIEQGLSLAIFSGSNKIYIHGVELNGIAYLMTNKESHFSGKDTDYDNCDSWNYARAMNSSSRSIRQWHKLSDNCKKNGIELINLSKSGLLDFIKRDEFKNLFN
jgi:hypothetical protein